MKIISEMRGKNGLFLTIVVGLMVRMIFAAYTNHAATMAKIMHLDELFIIGGNPLLRASSFGVSFYLFYIPVYVLYLILGSFGIYHEFVLVALFRIPPIIGDVIIFYSLYEITTHLSQDKRKALTIASAYFLNPYTIWISSIIGHAESLMMGFVLLSLLYLFKRKIIHSAFSLGFAVNFRHLPLLLLPCFLAYLWKMDNPVFPRMSRFLAVFFGSVAIFSSPFVFPLFQMYLNSPSSFVAFMQHWLGVESAVSGTGEYSISLIKEFMYNFTGILANFDLWPLLKEFFGFRNFLVVYSVITIFFLKYSEPSPARMNRYAIIIYTLFMIMTPLVQHQYLIWVFPFLFLGASLFNTLPKHLLHVLWITNMLIDPIIDGGFFWYLDLTFPSPIRQNMWSIRNMPVETAISMLHAMVLLLIIILCFTSAYYSFRGSRVGKSVALPKPLSRFFKKRD